ncbi:CPS_HP_G0079360.mRNA.1.CDS.1 [Saccharomyces cerevisiae]|nr:CPS_HP_G0079360.mRNA.1.CDS.1 [Saccharomyces cerevisiae]CAI6919895.1 CPS_HP_G0079360.mRNA.1.CDS.1 [Saccharomyces cerevisiae]
MLLLSRLVKVAATPGLQVVLLPARKLLPLLLQPLQPPLLKLLLLLLHPLAPLNYLVTPVLLMPSPLVLV